MKKGGTAMSVYKVVEIIGTSPKSWEDAVQKAITTAGKSIEKLRVAQVMEQDVTVDKGKVMEYRIKLNVSFKLKDV
jgi:flavin-binding protein dodecin